MSEAIPPAPVRRFKFKVAGLDSSNQKFSCDGILKVKEGESAIDVATVVTRNAFGDQGLQFSKITVKEIA